MWSGDTNVTSPVFAVVRDTCKREAYQHGFTLWRNRDFVSISEGPEFWQRVPIQVLRASKDSSKKSSRVWLSIKPASPPYLNPFSKCPELRSLYSQRPHFTLCTIRWGFQKYPGYWSPYFRRPYPNLFTIRRCFWFLSKCLDVHYTFFVFSRCERAVRVVAVVAALHASACCCCPTCEVVQLLAIEFVGKIRVTG